VDQNYRQVQDYLEGQRDQMIREDLVDRDYLLHSGQSLQLVLLHL